MRVNREFVKPGQDLLLGLNPILIVGVWIGYHLGFVNHRGAIGLTILLGAVWLAALVELVINAVRLLRRRDN